MSRALDKFTNEQLVIDATARVPLDDLWTAWRGWSIDQGHRTGMRNDVIRDLIDRLQLRRERRHGVTELVGIRLRTDRDHPHSLGGARPWR